MTVGDNSKIALIVGVSGHRDLIDADTAEIRTRIASELEKIEALAKGVRLVLLSGLAEGSDQLVAEEALKRKWEVFAAFPMPFADFMDDFEADSQREALVELKEQCSAINEIPWAATLDRDIATPRDQQYRNQSIFVVRQAQVVIALWDGIAAQPSGACGTAYVADLCRKGPPPIEGEVLAAPETTSLIHIPVRRRSEPDLKPILQPTLPSDRIHLQICRELSTYARAAARLGTASPQEIRQSREWLIDDDSLNKLDNGTVTLIDQYCHADALARDQQGKRNLAVKVASIATVIGAFAQATSGILSESSWMIAYGAAVSLAYGLYIILFRLPFLRIEDHYLEYRALAEAIRVQVFWRMAGLSKVAAEHYLQLVKTEVGWVREALRSISLCVAMSSSTIKPAVDVAKKCWIDDQAKYFVGKNPALIGGKALGCKKLQQRFDLAANASLLAGAVLVAIASAAIIYPVPASVKAAASAYSASFFLMAGVIKGYVSSMGYGEQAISYEKMGAIFLGVQRFFEQEQADRSECLFALGKQALAENAEWLIQHRKNAFKVQS